ncbi:V-set and transmembrane domain-containing protein 2-like protein [Collichthys lucidus]|uniref:V-set and transmembrane domain-containing protein 2-like protein n=1 Tax=Collichthys lucidus TaxID=240159 RepID=A0A4U5UQ05_COLLU|nr:V-set and transmembrane domain-containing protein 2-like protein [Collichthys lucidus]
MGAFRVLLGSLHYMGLCMQLSVCTRQAGHGEIQNHISGNGMKTLDVLTVCARGDEDSRSRGRDSESSEGMKERNM